MFECLSKAHCSQSNSGHLNVGQRASDQAPGVGVSLLESYVNNRKGFDRGCFYLSSTVDNIITIVINLRLDCIAYELKIGS